MKTVQNVLHNFDVEAELHEARQRCFWFIDGYFMHGLSVELFAKMSTETICEIYNVDIRQFRPYETRPTKLL